MSTLLRTCFLRPRLCSTRYVATRSLITQIARPPASITRDTFVEEYFARQPIFIEDYFSRLPAIAKWPPTSFSYLDKYGDKLVPIEISQGDASYSSSNASTSFERAEVPLSIFLQFLKQAELSLQQGITLSDVRIYLAQHALFDSIPELYEDVCQSNFLKDRVGRLVPALTTSGRSDIYNINAWIGTSTHTPLHRDPYHNVYAQLYGIKDVILFPPESEGGLKMHCDPLLKNTSTLQNLFEDQGQVDESVLSKAVHGRLQPGDGLYIPEGWLHTFRGEKGITASVNWWFK